MILFESIQIQTINDCNLRCGFCPNSYLTQSGKLMDEKLYYKIIDELAELRYCGRISPYLMNEPLLDDRLTDFVGYVRKSLPGATIMISTNGVLLDRNLLSGLIKAGLDRLIVSCYSKGVYNMVKAYNREEISPIPFFERDIDKAFYNRGGNVDVGEKPVGRGECKKPFVQMYIDYLGRAILCCSDYKKEVIMGDVNKEKLVDIWSNKKYAQYRNHLVKGERSKLELCNKCNY